MSLGMYDLKPVFDLDAKVDIPDCMYRYIKSNIVLRRQHFKRKVASHPK